MSQMKQERPESVKEQLELEHRHEKHFVSSISVYGLLTRDVQANHDQCHNSGNENRWEGAEIAVESRIVLATKQAT